MKTEIRSLLLPFYFGSVTAQDRLIVERELLEDPESLVNYLDLKRDIESAEKIPQMESARVWSRLREKIPVRRKFVWAVGLPALATVLIFAIIFSLRSNQVTESKGQREGILFDSGSELPNTSNVL